MLSGELQAIDKAESRKSTARQPNTPAGRLIDCSPDPSPARTDEDDVERKRGLQRGKKRRLEDSDDEEKEGGKARTSRPAWPSSEAVRVYVGFGIAGSKIVISDYRNLKGIPIPEKTFTALMGSAAPRR